ncbi:hypothetical protein K438DRAFT_1819349 [Mycena galopus ATCC 62051]|nr:hypothetical protein K438DRAFT_1819349 [Mycena galopus ATCC 62051]
MYRSCKTRKPRKGLTFASTSFPRIPAQFPPSMFIGGLACDIFFSQRQFFNSQRKKARQSVRLTLSFFLSVFAGRSRFPASSSCVDFSTGVILLLCLSVCLDYPGYISSGLRQRGRYHRRNKTPLSLHVCGF